MNALIAHRILQVAGAWDFSDPAKVLKPCMSFLLEVVSKFQIGFKGPAKRDYMSILNRLMDASSVRPIGKAQHTWVCEHLPDAVLHLTL
jgi:hypothetical protein